MSNHSDSERERLIRLREKQLEARDPHTKQRQFNRMASERERRVDRRVTVGQAWRDVPHVWRGVLIGLVLGVLILIILPSLWSSVWALPVAIFVALLMIFLVVIIGNALDLRDKIRHLSR